jgi:hypothetical protein
LAYQWLSTAPFCAEEMRLEPGALVILAIA